MISDLELINGCKKQDRKFQKELYQRFARKMLAVCLCYTGDEFEAENIVQEGFIKVFENIHKFELKGSLEGWVRRIMVNTALDFYRKKRKMNFLEIGTETLEERYGSFDIDRFNVQDILIEIQKLPHGSRMVFTLYAIEGFTHAEIADQLSISVGTSKSQYSRARHVLQQKLLKEDENIQPKRFGWR